MKILFTTLHAKYVHSSLALPCLAAACADLPGLDIRLLELTVNEQPDQLLSKLYAARADAVLFSCYIWNTELTLKLASDLKQLAPRTLMVLGGPEVSFGSFETMVRHPAVDCVVRGEGEATCRDLLQAFRDHRPLADIAGITYRDGEEVVANPERGAVERLDAIPSPFAAGLADLAKPLVYYESSRGCPFSCAFCMSSIESGVRSFSMERIRADLGLLMAGGAKTVKFVDRTFNYDAARANDIWRFILEHNRESRFHFEIAADLLTDDNLALLARVPADTFRFEIGVQSGEEQTLAAVSRKSSLDRLYENVRRLKSSTRVTVHLDLVAGLPGESPEGFLASLQGLFDLEPDHVQVEALKVMKGTAMRGIARREGYAYSECAPYKILRTPWLSYRDILRIDGIGRLLEQFYNSGRFDATLAEWRRQLALSRLFDDMAALLDEQHGPASNSLPALFDQMWRFACARLEGEALERMRDALSYDYCLTGYPGGAPPLFFHQEKLPVENVAASLPRATQPGERIRYYRRSFPRDYRLAPWAEGPVQLTFVYRSAPGRGLQVEVL